MKTKLLLIAAAALVCFAACTKDPDNNSSGESNWWYNNGMVEKGIKSIAYNNYTNNYDKSGRLVSSTSQWGEETYTYNTKGLPVTMVSKGMEDGKVVSESTTTLEYKNSGKFCPIPMGPGSIFHIYENGLLPGLSKVTFKSEGEEDHVMEYKFEGNKLTVSTSGKYTYMDESGKMVEEDYEDIEIEYNGAYPVKLDMEHEFIGPLTYQENGMFDTYVEGFYSWEIKGFVTLERTRTVSKSFKNMMLMEKEVSKWYNDGEASPYDIETIVDTYDEKGNLIKEVTTHTAALSTHYETTYEYEVDAKGNWTKMKATTTTNSPLEPTRTFEESRTIEYY